MTYTVEPGKVLRKRMPTRDPGTAVNEVAAHALLITDIEFFTLTAWLRAERAGLQELADRVALVGLDWEHLEALMPHNRGEITSENFAELNRLAVATEVLAAEIDVRTGVVDRNGNPFPPYRESQGGDR